MILARKLVIWGTVAVLAPIATVAWRPVARSASWQGQIDHGELLLIAIVLLAGGVAFAAMASLAGDAGELVKSIVVGGGLVILVVEILVYAVFSEGPKKGTPAHPHPQPTAGYIAFISYVFLALSFALTLSSTCLTHVADSRRGTET